MTEIKKWVVEQWDDLNITARFIDTIYDTEPSGYEFELYEVVAWEGKNFDQKLYERKESTQSGDFSENGLEDAQPYLTGFIKWDGCSHFYFGDDGYLHLCGLDEIEKLGVVLERLKTRAKDKGVTNL
jgi:hypothetical protein